MYYKYYTKNDDVRASAVKSTTTEVMCDTKNECK